MSGIEPWAEGQWVMVLAKIAKEEDQDADDERNLYVQVPYFREEDNEDVDFEFTYVRKDCIEVASSPPEWAPKCTSLSGDGGSLMRCENQDGHDGKHMNGAYVWTDADEAGRITARG